MMPQWVHNVATVLTILSFPLTVLSLNTTFDFAPIVVQFPEMPFGGSIKVVAFLLASIVVAIAFADWYRRVDFVYGVDRLVTVPVLGFISAAQSFAVLQILLGSFDVNSMIYGIGMFVALAIETKYLLKNMHKRKLQLALLNALAFGLFSLLAAAEATTSSHEGPVVAFAFAFFVPLAIFLTAGLFVMVESNGTESDKG